MALLESHDRRPPDTASRVNGVSKGLIRRLELVGLLEVRNVVVIFLTDSTVFVFSQAVLEVEALSSLRSHRAEKPLGGVQEILHDPDFTFSESHNDAHFLYIPGLLG